MRQEGRKNKGEFCTASIPMKNTMKNGMTILELVVAVGIFSFVVLAAFNLIIAISDAHVKAANLQTVQDNIRFSLELMTKELRTGYGYKLTAFCTALGSGTEISLTAVDSTGVPHSRIYFWKDLNGAGPDTIMRVTAADCSNASTVSPFTSDEIIVDRLNFIVHGNTGTPGFSDGQPMVTIVLRVKSRDVKSQVKTNMDIQTTITQRVRDF